MRLAIFSLIDGHRIGGRDIGVIVLFLLGFVGGYNQVLVNKTPFVTN